MKWQPGTIDWYQFCKGCGRAHYLSQAVGCYCKECATIRQRESFAKHAEERRRAARARYVAKRMADGKKRRLPATKDVVAARKAYYLVRKACQQGQLQKPDACENCGKLGFVEAHHPDYALALSVNWLCHSCHVNSHVA